jgi:hypothetical protein
MKNWEYYTTIGDSKLYYDINMGEFVVDRFDEYISLGDVSYDEAVAKVEEIEK